MYKISEDVVSNTREGFDEIKKNHGEININNQTESEQILNAEKDDKKNDE